MSPSKSKLEAVSKDIRDQRHRRWRSRRRGKHSRPRYVAGVSALMYAAQQGDVDAVRKIIEIQGSSLFQRDRTGKTALHYSSTSGSRCASQAADLMVMAAPELVDGKDEDGFTPLHLAVIAGNMQLVTFLLANGADINAVDNEKHTVVHWAAVCGETSALRAVLAAGAQVSTPDVHGGYPLHYAAQMCGGDRESNLGMQVLQTLLSHPDIKVSETDVDKRQPLLWAASAGSARAVLALVRAGANVEAADKDGLTALHCAASRGHTDCMDTLLTLCGASVDIIDTNGCTALHYAVTLGHADATALLLAHGADPNRQDRKGRSPAHCGCAKGQFETVKLIGAHGANLWLRNARGDFPLHDAAASGRRELVKWLLEMRPSQVNARNNDGRCSLHMAALNDNADMCKILLDGGAQVNPVLRTSKNIFMTPLDCALQRGYRSTAKYLQLHGGVPASRLSDPNNQQMNSALNLHIRDDVTLYGDTSSGSEKEIADKSEKKHIKKKVSHTRQEKKKASLSSSEQSETDKRKLPKQKSVEERRKTPSRIDYSNEIIINGKTEVNISQSGEIILNRESVHTQTSAKLTEKDRRPRSAKFGRLRDKSAQSSLNKEPMVSISSQASVSKIDHSTSTSEGINDTIKEVEVNVPDNGTILQEQHSTISYTSEDAEGSKKDILVEASVHPQPKEDKLMISQETTDISKPQEETNNIDKNNIEDNSEVKDVIDVALEAGKLTEATEIPVELESTENFIKIEDETQPETGDFEKLDEITDADGKVEVDALETMKIEEPIEINETVVPTETIDSTDEAEKTKTDITEQIASVKQVDIIIPKSTDESKEIGNTDSVEVLIKKSDDFEKEVLIPIKQEDKKNPIEVNDEVINKPRKAETRSKVIKQRKNDEDDMKKNLDDVSSFSENEDFIEKTHKSFRILRDKELDDLDDTKRKKYRRKKDLPEKETRSKSLDNKLKNDKFKRSKIPTPLFKSTLSKSDRNLNESYKETNLDTRVPSLPNIRDERNALREPTRCDSNMSAPLLTSVLSDKDKDSLSEIEDEITTKNKRFVKKRPKHREARSAGSDYESSNLIDSGFEPSPRSTRVPRWKNMSERGVNMTSVTQNIQTNIRRYHLERKIFQQLLELKRHQIRAGQHNEAILVKRAIDAYHKSCASTVGAGRYTTEDYTFKSFEKFLYEALRKLQKNGVEYMRGLPETPSNPLLCTKSTNRCMHAAHAYTGVPCAAYLPKMDHHSIPKIGFNSVDCKPGTGGFLPTINPKKTVTLELSHGNDKQVISLPTNKLDQNKRYYVTFTVKGHEAPSDDSTNNNNNGTAHKHSKSD